MKKLLLALLIVPVIGFGQLGDSTKLRTLTLTEGTNITSTGLLTMSDTYQRKADTLKCIMLVCDTTHVGIDIETAIYKGVNYYNKVYWQFGYQVTEFGSLIGSGKRYFIDEYKKPLPKTIIIWQSKPLSQ